MKHFVAPALVLAIVAVLVLGRSVIVTAQQPDAAASPAASQPALPIPSGDFAVPVAPPLPPVAPPQPPSVATLNDLVRALVDIRQKKAELQQQEEKLTAAIRKKMDEEKKVHEAVLRLLGTTTRDDPKVEVNSIQEQRAKPDAGDTPPK